MMPSNPAEITVLFPPSDCQWSWWIPIDGFPSFLAILVARGLIGIVRWSIGITDLLLSLGDNPGEGSFESGCHGLGLYQDDWYEMGQEEKMTKPIRCFRYTETLHAKGRHALAPRKRRQQDSNWQSTILKVLNKDVSYMDVIWEAALPSSTCLYRK